MIFDIETNIISENFIYTYTVFEFTQKYLKFDKNDLIKSKDWINKIIKLCKNN